MATDPDARLAIAIAIQRRLAAGPAGLSVRQLSIETGRWPSTVQAAISALAETKAIRRLPEDPQTEQHLTAHDAAHLRRAKELLSLPLTKWEIADPATFDGVLRELRWRSPGWRVLEVLAAAAQPLAWADLQGLFRGPREAVATLRRLSLAGAIDVVGGLVVPVAATLNLPPNPRLVRTVLAAWARQHNAIASHLHPEAWEPADLDEIARRVAAAEQEWAEAHERAERVLVELGVFGRQIEEPEQPPEGEAEQVEQSAA